MTAATESSSQIMLRPTSRGRRLFAVFPLHQARLRKALTLHSARSYRRQVQRRNRHHRRRGRHGISPETPLLPFPDGARCRLSRRLIRRGLSGQDLRLSTGRCIHQPPPPSSMLRHSSVCAPHLLGRRCPHGRHQLHPSTSPPPWLDQARRPLDWRRRALCPVRPVRMSIAAHGTGIRTTRRPASCARRC